MGTVVAKRVWALALGFAGPLAAVGAGQADPEIVASIKPVHSLVAAVMEGAGEPALIVAGAGSPHAHNLRPSQARALERAEVIFWIGPGLEAFLAKPIATLGKRARVVELMETTGLTKRALRQGGVFDDDGHGGEPSAAGDAATGMAREGRDGSAGFNAHIWLDPQNAKAMVGEIERTLTAADPGNAAIYRANAEAVAGRLDGLTADIAAMLKPVSEARFIVFHDAYRHFEDRFGLAAAGALTVSPEVMPGVERVAAIREEAFAQGTICVFSEPQFEHKLVAVVSEGSGAKSGVLDPIGVAIDDGSELYFTLLRDMASSLRDCLDPGS